ncbi:MAG TPA: sugar-binding protein [Polyangiales bacterium]|nr:sugar-binding protein [Polyangiales bacterium]
MARALLLLVVCVLGLSGCLRFGYKEHPEPAADGGKVRPFVTVKADAGGISDAAAAGDASSEADAATPTSDAATSPDAASPPDSGMSLADASALPDAADSTPDAATDDDAATMTDAGPSCTRSAARDYCSKLPALPQAPKIDGVLDCGPTLVDLPASGWTASQSLPGDNHARYAAAWRPDGLYFYVEVDDALLLPALASHVDPWCGDGVELYADADGKYVSAPDYDDPGAMQLLATAPARDASTALAVDARYHTRSQSRAGDWAKARHVSVTRSGGYALEAFVAAADLELNSWTLAAGGTVGFDIAINVSVANESSKVGCGYYLGQYYLRLSRTPCSTDNCRPYSNAAAFCTALLE